MRKLENKFIITFPTTTTAMAMEKAGLESGTPGRLIPTPTVISAGCGMCWCTEPENEPVCMELIENRGLVHEKTYHL